MPFSPDNGDIPAELSGEILDDAEAEAFDGVDGKQEATAIVGDPLNSNRSLPDRAD